jgi:hypothetical protein
MQWGGNLKFIRQSVGEFSASASASTSGS